MTSPYFIKHATILQAILITLALAIASGQIAEPLNLLPSVGQPNLANLTR